MIQRNSLKENCRQIFAEALRAVDAGTAIRKAVSLSGLQLRICDEVYELTEQTPIYVIAFGKAAYPMAQALDDILVSKIKGGIVSGFLPQELKVKNADSSLRDKRLSDNWRLFAGGHPLPNEASLAAAHNCFKLLRAADNEHAIVIFLISGGGSAMIEAPIDDSITLAEMRETNRALVSCGATIGEINLVRRSFSRIKGGGLAAYAPRAKQISLIVSDTEKGDEASVASGPTMEVAPIDSDKVKSVFEQYDLRLKIPNSVLNVITRKPLENSAANTVSLPRYHVLLDNQSAINAAAASANAYGFKVEVASDITEQHVETGCMELLNRLIQLHRQNTGYAPICLISGGEFSCPVRGEGKGGRNSETALRMALQIGEYNYALHNEIDFAQIAFLSAGTDGIDGNSPAAGAVCDEQTISRALKRGLNPQFYLDNSDAYEFFYALEDSVITGLTGTNVRDVRIMIASK